jgi:transposase
MAWLPNLSKQQLEERRREAARLLRQGQLSQAEIAQELGVSRTAVCQWAKQLEQQGLRGLAARAVSGRPAQMSRADWRRLLTMLKRGAKRAGFPTERWTLIRIHSLSGVNLAVLTVCRTFGANCIAWAGVHSVPSPAPVSEMTNWSRLG